MKPAVKGNVRSRISRHKMAFCILIQILILVIWFVCSVGTQEKFSGYYNSPENRYYSVYGNPNRDGYYVDEEYGQEGVFTCGPYMELPKGIYRITVFYEARGTGHTCVAYDEDSVRHYVKGVECDTVILDEDHTSKSFDVWVSRDVGEFEVRTFYGGDGSLRVRGVAVEEKKVSHVYPIVRCGLLLMLLDIAVAFVYRARRQQLSGQSVVTGMLLFAVISLVSAPALRSGLVEPQVTDFNFVLMRIEGLKDGILSGHFPVRIQPNWLNDYGYATSVFYGDLFLIIPALLRIVGFPIQEAWNIFCIGINTFTCLSAYFCFKGMFSSRKIGVVGSMLFTLSSYRIVHLLASPKGGTSLAYMCLPLVAYGLYLIYYDATSRKSWILLALGMTGILQSHLLTCVCVGFSIGLVIVLSLFRFCHTKSIWAMGKAVLAALLLNMGFLVPCFSYMNEELRISSDTWKTISGHIQKQGGEFAEYFNLFKERPAEATVDVVLVAGMFTFLIIWLVVPRGRLSEENQKYRDMGSIAFLAACVLIFLSTEYFPWDFLYDHIPFLRGPIHSIQFPVPRLHGSVTVLAVLIMCCNIKMLQECLCEQRWGLRAYVMGVCGISLLVAAVQISNVLNNSPVENRYDVAGLDVNRISTKEYLPEGADPELFTMESASAGDGVAISGYARDKLDISVECVNDFPEDSWVNLPLVYYPGYVAVDRQGRELEVVCSEQYTVQVILPGYYEGKIDVSFRDPVTWTVSFWISICSAVLLTGYAVIGGICRKRRGLEGHEADQSS